MKTLDTWKEVEKLLSNYKIYVLNRDKDSMEDIIQSNSLLKQYRKSFYRIAKEVTSNLSSTYVRGKIKEKKSIEYLTPPEIVTYILENQLYQ